jgi:hypothetical protein
MAKLILNVPTHNAAAGDEINVTDKDLADELVANGSARRATASKKAEPASS